MNMRMTADNSRANPFLATDWRWSRAAKIARGELSRRRGLDDAVRAAIAFLRHREQPTACSGRRRKGTHDATIAAALAMREENGARRWEVGARVLANQPAEEIAARCGLTVATVTWYEQLFFDCRPRLNAWGWVVSQVFGDRLRHGFGDDELGLIWQAIAYFGGSIVLNAVIEVTKTCGRAGELPMVSACLSPDSGVPVQMQAVLAMLVAPQMPALDTVFCLRLLKANTLRCPNAAAAARDHVAKEIVEAARAVLIGAPIPQPMPQPGKTQATHPPAQGDADPELRERAEMEPDQPFNTRV